MHQLVCGVNPGPPLCQPVLPYSGSCCVPGTGIFLSYAGFAAGRPVAGNGSVRPVYGMDFPIAAASGRSPAINRSNPGISSCCSESQRAVSGR